MKFIKRVVPVLILSVFLLFIATQFKLISFANKIGFFLKYDHYDVDSGTFITGFQMPLVVYKDICLSKYNVTLVGRSEHEVLSWSYCCNLIEKPFGNCTRVMMNICSILKDKADFDINSITFDETKKKALKWKKEYSYWYYTHNTQERVGHAVNRLLQLYHLISFSKSNPLKMPSVSLIVSARSPMLSGAYVVDLANYLIPNWKSMSIFSEDFNKEVNGSICFEKLVEVDPYQHEQVFFSKSQGEEWRSFLNLNFNIEDKLCPPAKAVVLQRIEGTGLRKILNYEILEKVLKKYNINTYKNVTVHEKLSLKEQIKVFNNFGIMIASHSSQLKNLIFAPRNAIIIVTRPTPVGYLEPNNFALGMREIDLIFEDSVDHLPDYSSCPEKHGLLRFCSLRQNLSSAYVITRL